jgi:hypothetical protein
LCSEESDDCQYELEIYNPFYLGKKENIYEHNQAKRQFAKLTATDLMAL